MTNLEYLEIYEDWIDRVVGKCEHLAKQAGIDSDDIDEAVSDYLYSTPIQLDRKAGVNLSTVIISEYLFYTQEKVDEQIRFFGFDCEDLSIEYCVDGSYSDLSVNNKAINPNDNVFLEAVSKVLCDKLSELSDIIPIGEIKKCISEALESSNDIYDLIGDAVANVVDIISDRYELEIYTTCDNRGINLEFDDGSSNTKDEMKIDDFVTYVKELVAEQEKEIKNKPIERNE